MFYVGIDVAKYKHDFAIIDDNGLVIVPPKTIQNSLEGFGQLLTSTEMRVYMLLHHLVRYLPLLQHV